MCDPRILRRCCRPEVDVIPEKKGLAGHQPVDGRAAITLTVPQSVDTRHGTPVSSNDLDTYVSRRLRKMLIETGERPAQAHRKFKIGRVVRGQAVLAAKTHDGISPRCRRCGIDRDWQ